MSDATMKKLALKEARKKQKPFKDCFKRDWQLYSLLLIPIIFCFIFKYVPMAWLQIAFKDWKIRDGFFGGEWVGFEIFAKVFGHRNFLKSLRNTLLLNVLDLIVGFPMPIILALMLNEIKNIAFKKVTQTLLYLPHFLSWVIIGGLVYQLFSVNTGVVNALIQNAGGTPINFLQEDTNWLITYIIIGAWQSMGWGTIIYLASITSVNSELYEAARVDGANRWQQMMNVTLPCIRSTIVILLIMQLGKIMGGSFERIMALMNYATTEYTMTIPVLVYQWGIQDMKFSQSTALGLFQSVIGLALVLGSDWISKKLGEDGLV
ncbi:MAG: ABC transporter permease subunit [Lachnospiraceae bacterium]|nr:ABC transporter permease subunit [Lachnospiraceae bacterium]MDE6965318.1 ABC transporter permease subunit [Lachnospiraceae bacterium]